MYLIAGLGNPGARYKNTRHNIGFNVINLWGKSIGIRLNGRRFQSRNARTIIRERKVMLLRPTTFMNLSGLSILACAEYYSLKPSDILVIHDDLDLPVGRIKVVGNGGAGGHKGVLSIIQNIDSAEFSRVKIGIGRPRYRENIEDYVLSPFYHDEMEMKTKIIHMAISACELCISTGIESAMNHINNKNLMDKEVIN